MKKELSNSSILTLVTESQDITVPPGELGAILELTVRDRAGKITRHYRDLSRSFVRQFLQALWLQASFVYGGDSGHPVKLKATDGESYYFQADNDNFSCGAGTGITDMGILVGTGITAPDINDYALEALIPHGVNPGQMQYSAVTFGAPTSDGATSHFTITRDFSNASGSPVTVKEIGLAVRLDDYQGTPRYVLTIRDAVSIDVPNGETLTVNYRIQAAV